MDDRDQRRYDADARGQIFAHDNQADFAPTSDFHTHFDALGTALKAVDHPRDR